MLRHTCTACKFHEIPMTKTKLLQATPQMAAQCFRSLTDHLARSQSPTTTIIDISEDMVVDGLFVTWETLFGELRGCIGCLRELPLSSLSEYAITSGRRDSRFSPITEKEMGHLLCKVSILHSVESCSHSLDWTIGVHGIIVEFSSDGVPYKSTFLPGVMPEQGWDREEAIKQACRKSGYRGRFSAISSALTVVRYQSSVASITYSEFISKYSH